ncbi:glycosyltransferase family 2 protein [Streptomyces syringium]|uniref:glycosyltransferase family 2 protein n=1 Tax=Streptomyces syringium TaxID=76729 RepID=UPI003429A102
MAASDSETFERDPDAPPVARVSVIVIGFNDAGHIRDAVHSALAQGPAVAEVIAVDDASTDRTGAFLDELAARHPRLRVIHRPANSGGCGTPRNDGVRAATAPYVMFLDSDDVLPPGAADALLGAALRHRAPVSAGLCVRRELPRHHDTRWQPGLYRRPAVRIPGDHPALVHDTLCVNKLYARDFLTAHGIAFPEGPFPYEDFVFTAQVLAAAPRVATVPDTVYIWHVRRDAAKPSISLDRDRVANWRARLAAHRRSVEILLDSGGKPLAHAARVKFLDHDLRMYVRELPTRSPAYRRAWWRLARDRLAGYEEVELCSARLPARWIARVVLASETPRDLDRLSQLAARPARLLPPYAETDGRPVWAEDLPRVELDGLTGPGSPPPHRLPITVDAAARALTGPRAALRGMPSLPSLSGLRPWPFTRADDHGPPPSPALPGADTSPRPPVTPGAPPPPRPPAPAGPRLELGLRVHDLYGRLAVARPHTVDIELRHRDGRALLTRSLPLAHDGSQWTAHLSLGLSALAARGRRDGTTAPQVWDVRVRVHCATGASFRTTVRAVGSGLRRTALPSLRHGILLAQPYATAGGSLALRLAPGARSALDIALRRLRRARARFACRGRHGLLLDPTPSDDA